MERRRRGRGPAARRTSSRHAANSPARRRKHEPARPGAGRSVVCCARRTGFRWLSSEEGGQRLISTQFSARLAQSALRVLAQSTATGSVAMDVRKRRPVRAQASAQRTVSVGPYRQPGWPGNDVGLTASPNTTRRYSSASKASYAASSASSALLAAAPALLLEPRRRPR